MDVNVKKSCVERLARVEGQVRGLSRMIEDDRYCIDIVTQMSAVQAALRKVEEELLKNHAAHCIENAIANGNADEQRQKVKELIELLGRRRSS
jgi:CsoR family transcriptional regulator, copper-sensing transcriptional repressor